jgi:hypothetical protein
MTLHYPLQNKPLQIFAYPAFHSLVDIDDFVGKLWQTHLAVKKEGYVQVGGAW